MQVKNCVQFTKLREYLLCVIFVFSSLWLAMGLTKQYLRYVASAVFGVIGSQKANIAFVTLRGGEKGRYVAVGACEHVFIWDVRKAEKVFVLNVLEDHLLNYRIILYKCITDFLCRFSYLKVKSMR